MTSLSFDALGNVSSINGPRTGVKHEPAGDEGAAGPADGDDCV